MVFTNICGGDIHKKFYSSKFQVTFLSPSSFPSDKSYLPEVCKRLILRPQKHREKRKKMQFSQRKAFVS